MAFNSGDTDVLKEKELGLWHGIFQSFSHVAPAAEVAILVTGTALVAEGSTPLIFILAPIIVLLWLNTNYQFSKYISSSGGYSAFSRAGLGKGSGDMTGWLFFFNEFLSYTGFALLSFAAFIYLLEPSITAITYIWIPSSIRTKKLEILYNTRIWRCSEARYVAQAPAYS